MRILLAQLAATLLFINHLSTTLGARWYAAAHMRRSRRLWLRGALQVPSVTLDANPDNGDNHVR